jgi:hypothetical protein
MTFPVHVRIHTHHIAMAITALLMMHIVGMAVNPIGMHADGQDGSSHTHATTMSHDHGHATATHAGHGMVLPDESDDLTILSALTCIDTQGVASHPRVPLQPQVFMAVLPVPMVSEVRPCADASPVWSPPAMDGKALRVMLQVFLN